MQEIILLFEYSLWENKLNPLGNLLSLNDTLLCRYIVMWSILKTSLSKLDLKIIGFSKKSFPVVRLHQIKQKKNAKRKDENTTTASSFHSSFLFFFFFFIFSINKPIVMLFRLGGDSCHPHKFCCIFFSYCKENSRRRN